MTGDELDGWIFLSGRDKVTQVEYAEAMSLNSRTAQRHLARFVERGLLKRTGQGRSTTYV